MNISILSSTDKDTQRYNTFISEHKEANAYHTLNWQKTIQESYNTIAQTIIATHNQKIVAAINTHYISSWPLGKRHISTPYSHYCPPLCSEIANTPSFFEKVYSQILKSSSDYCEIKAPIKGYSTYCKNIITTLDLAESIDTLESNLSSSTRRNLKKSQKSSIKINTSNDLSSYRAFYKLQSITRKRQGSPMYPKNFFDNIFHHMAEHKLATCILAELDSQPIAGIIRLDFGKRAIYAYGASIFTPSTLKHKPNNLLMWEAITGAKAKGIDLFDFGSTPLHHKNLIQYKESWGGKSTSLEYTRFPHVTSSANINRNGIAAKAVTQMIQRSPIWLNERLGPIILRSLA